ncbi:division plane positioning ATPase MipZ [Emcibacter nanhaiensis]|uniref:ATPase n=1 Tax=Emcibacter nanhaiensis TaxID=1505037 RepID=A0A501PSF8_9PROT|nr:division plane positioning ATPase MipZ [Emcibacter nanhaiensis]TPD63185.1 ATPase [Emcibacter nanhaiensis]
MVQESPARKTTGAHVIVVGNEKGGSGKSTTAMHVVVSLLKKGFSVAVLDLDARQKSLARYLENRQNYAEQHNLKLTMPEVHVVPKSTLATKEEMDADEIERFNGVMDGLRGTMDFILIDCPGSDSHLSRIAHAAADTLITPINDSFVDLDLLAQVNPDNFKVEKLSLYSEMVWDAKKRRALADRGNIDWIVMRNRTSALDAKNKRRVHKALKELEKRVNFRYVAGLGERVIYREMFPKGLTLVDFRDADSDKMTMSHVAARQEIRRLMDDLKLPGWNESAAAAAE